MKILVCGGRKYWDYDKMRRALDTLKAACSVTEVIHGDARGADRLAGLWARDAGIPERKFPAQWHLPDGTIDRGAGHYRNAIMLTWGKPDLVVAFEGGGGTLDMIERSVAAGIRIILVP